MRKERRTITEAANSPLFLGVAKGDPVFIEPFHTLFAGQTNLSGKTTTIIALAGEAVKKGYTILIFDTKPTIREFAQLNRDIPVCYQPTTDSLVLINLLEAIFKRKLTMYYSTLNRLSDRAKDIKDVIRNAEKMEESAKSGFIKDACHTLADLLRRLDAELSQINFTAYLGLVQGQINVMPINKLSNEAQQLVLKTAFEQVLKEYNRNTIVVVDEAFRFFPQDYGSACKKAGQDLITQGAKTKLFVWISTQFLAPTDKDPMKACPNKLFGRQDHNTEIDAAIKLVPGGKKTLNPDQLMTLKRGEFLYVPLEGKPKKVLVTPPWERQGPKEDPRQEIEALKREVASLKDQAAHGWKLPAARTEALDGPVGPVSTAPPDILRIDHSDTIVQIHHGEPRLAPVRTDDTKGRILFVIAEDFKGGPATPEQISQAALEYGWQITTELVRITVTRSNGILDKGYLVKEDNAYRIPGKVKFEVVKE